MPRKYRILTKEEKAEFSRLYPCTSNDELSHRFGLTLKQLALVAWRMGLKKNPEVKIRRVNNPPHNKLRQGSVQLRQDGYYWTKGDKGNWLHLHQKNWIDTYGPAPKGMVVAFKTDDRLNCDISNLELVSRKKILETNSIHNLPAELKELIYLRGILVRHINKMEKKSGA